MIFGYFSLLTLLFLNHVSFLSPLKKYAFHILNSTILCYEALRGLILLFVVSAYFIHGGLFTCVFLSFDS